MKKLMLLLLLAGVLQAKGQTFEGTVRWTMKMDITDPKMKAEMEKSQKQMDDPANQAKVKEMEAKMNDPQMKAMMEANPQMKAQMENAMKMMKGGGGANMNSMMPTGMTMRIKSQNTLTRMDGGMADGQEMLHQKDKNQTVRLDRKNKTYSVLPSGGKDGDASAAAAAAKITKTSETAKILGYNCTKYLAEVTEGGRPSTQIFWTTTDIKDFDMKSLASQRMGRGQNALFYDKIEGVPLKIEMASPQGNMVMEVAEIKRETLNANDFTIPSDFTEVKMPGRQ